MPPSLPLLAFELLNLSMLGWMAAAAAPILIHLWSRRRYREMYWAAMEYLLAALRHSRRRMSLEQLILLILRTALIVLIVLAVAEPIIQRTGFAAARGERTHRVIVLDGSFSMAYRPNDKTRFDRAKEIAARIVDESAEGDGFTLVLLSDPPRAVVGTPAFEARDFLKEIDGLELPHTSADLPRTLAEVEKVLLAARREAPRLTREEIYFLTDLGRVGWGLQRRDPTTVAEFRQRSQRLAQSAGLVVIDLGQPDAENLAITALRSSEPFATPGQSFEVQAVIKNFGRQGHGRVPVELLADGRRVKQEQVELPADGEATVSFTHRFDTPGDHTLEVRAEGDRLDVDNHRWLAVPVKDSIRVLCIDGRPSGDPGRGAAAYLAVALAPRKGRDGQAMVRPEVKPESALSEPGLDQYDCIFLSNVAQFTANEAKILETYLKRGGNMVFFLGDQVLADRYNQELGGEGQGGVRLLPARLGRVLGPQSRLDPLEYAHPIVQPFRGQEKAGLLTTPIQRYFELILPKKPRARVALAVGDGHPLIVEEPIHRGRVFLVATSADATWTAMPVWPSFVPLVQEMLSYAIAGQLQQRNVLVGEALGESFPPSVGEAAFTVRGPGARSDEGRLRADAESASWSYAETMQSGVYTARFGSPISRADAFAVNVDPIESDLATITPEQLRNEVWPDVQFIHQTTWQNPDAQPAAAVSKPSELTKMLLYAVLGLLFVETYLARRFGHY